MHGNYSSSGTVDLFHHLQHHLWGNVPLVSMFLSAPASGQAFSSLGRQQSVYLALGQVWGHRRVGFLSSSNIPRLEGIWVAASSGGRGWGWGWGKREAMPVVKGLLAEVWRVGKREGCGQAEVAVSILCGLFVISRLYGVRYSSALVCSGFKVLILLFWFFLFHSGSPDLGMSLYTQAHKVAVLSSQTPPPGLIFFFSSLWVHEWLGIFLRSLVSG